MQLPREHTASASAPERTRKWFRAKKLSLKALGVGPVSGCGGYGVSNLSNIQVFIDPNDQLKVHMGKAGSLSDKPVLGRHPTVDGLWEADLLGFLLAEVV